MNPRNLGIVGVLALLLLGVVAMRSFQRVEPLPAPLPAQDRDRAGVVTAPVRPPVAATPEEPQPPAEAEVEAAPGVIKAERGGYELVRIPGGTFLMGSPETEEGRWDFEGPQQQVAVPDFYLGRHPVTNAEYSRFLAANPDQQKPAFWDSGDFNQPQQPVVGVSWDEAVAYCDWAGLRLPSEAEWEYACRAGTATPRYGDLDAIAWHWGNSNGSLQPVGLKQPNAFGLHDMQGNVWEWCQDSWHETYEGAPVDGRPWEEPGASGRVSRGGSWNDGPRFCRSACRYRWHSGYRSVYRGFRPAR